MATFTNLENAHVFSKAVITPSMSAAAAGNTSAHTIQSKDTWAETVPFLTESDLSGVSADKEFKIEGYGTVKFHYKKNVYCLINSNNNDVPSNGYVGKIVDSEGNTISQFISPTDVVNDAGQMAAVYQPSLYDSKGESMPLSDYIINPSNGLIYDLKSMGNQGIFATSATDGRTEYKLSFFTYEGAKLDTTITNIKSSINETKNDLSLHADDTDIHITTSERSSWDTAAAKAATAVQDVTSGNAYLKRGTDNDNITLTLNVDTNLNDGGTANSVPSSAAVTSYGSSIISTHEAKKDGNKNIHVTAAERSSWDTAATKAGTAIQTVKRADDSSTLITVDQSETSVSITLSDTIATKEELSSHTSDTDIHITADERSKWNTTSQKTDRLTFPNTYTNFYDNQYYVNSYGFEYVKLIEDAWIQNIEVSVVLPELRDSLTEINLASGSTITPNIIGEKVCKILVAEGLNSDWGDNFNKNDDEIELGTSEYNICEKDKNNSLLVTLNFTFDQPIFLKANKDYRFYFYGRNENPYALPIIVNVDDSNNITNNRKEVASRNLYTRYDYFGVWGSGGDVPSPYAPYGLKVKLSKDIYSAFVAHENNNDIHVTKTDRENWNNSWENAISEEKYTITEYDKISGDYTTFVLPYNIVPVGSSINTVKLEITKGSPGVSAYLGAGLLSTDGSIKLLRVSNNAESISSSGILTWYFDEALELEENSRFVFYLLKNKEDFISPHPLVSSDVRICSRAARVVPGSDYSSWDNVISNLNYGFISNAANLEAGNYNSMWDEYPVCTLSKIHHVNNDIRHFKEGEHEQLFSDDERLFATTEELSIVEENINDINNEIETFNYDLAQSIETGNISNINNTRGFATLITDNITLAKVITYCHPSGGAENSNIWLKVFEKSAPHIFKGISDTSLNHAHGSSLEYTFKNSDIKLEANKEYFFVFCPDSQKSSTTFSTASDSVDCCIKTVNNTTGHGGMLGANAVTQYGVMALHKIYKKLGKFAFAFASDLEEHVDNFNNHVGDSTHITDAERTKWNSALYTITGSDYINISTDASKTISVTNIAESISDNTSDSLVTEGSVIKYADDTKDENGEIIEQGLLTKWHIENEYFHMQKSVADSLKSFNLDNYGLGDTCKGVIMNLPYLSKIKSISLVAVTASEYNQPLPEKAMTWSNYRLQIVDTLSGQVLATSEIGKNANTSANTASKGYPIGLFDFVDSNEDINQIYCDAKRDYQILFVNEAGETANIHLAYANGNGSSATYENYTFGELAPKVILPDGTIKEHPLNFSVALQEPVDCKGYACDFAVDTVKSEELTHLSKQIGELKNYIAYMNASINQLKS